MIVYYIHCAAIICVFFFFLFLMSVPDVAFVSRGNKSER